MVVWKPLGKGVNVGKTSSPFSTQEMMGGGGGGGGTHWGYKGSVPKASTGRNPGEMYSGQSINRTLDKPGIAKHIEPSRTMPFGDVPGATFRGKPVASPNSTSTGRVVGKEFSGNRANVNKTRRKVTGDFLRDMEKKRRTSGKMQSYLDEEAEQEAKMKRKTGG